MCCFLQLSVFRPKAYDVSEEFLIWQFLTDWTTGSIKNLAFLRFSEFFETLSLLHFGLRDSNEALEFSTQNLMTYNFWLRGLAKFRQVAILAIFGGYFGYFLKKR